MCTCITLVCTRLHGNVWFHDWRVSHPEHKNSFILRIYIAPIHEIGESGLKRKVSEWLIEPSWFDQRYLMQLSCEIVPDGGTFNWECYMLLSSLARPSNWKLTHCGRKLCHCLHSDSASPKPRKRRRATLIIFLWCVVVKHQKRRK